jgi:fimbrial isopeptide formation D2 family protein/LPXTG-motif cell wall-anchored protein
MKHTARNAILTGLLAASMAFSAVPATAFATPTSSHDVADSTVTISGVKAGDTVSAYLIADADIDANNNLTWKMTTGLPTNYDTIDELSAVASDGYDFKGVGTDAQKAAGAIAASSAVAGATASATTTATSDSAQLTLGSGYYLVRVTNGEGNNDVVYQNMIVDLTPKAAENGVDYASHDAVSANAKKEDVNLQKKSHEKGDTTGFTKTEVKTFSVGDTVPFQITAAVPSYPADAKNAVFTITDDPDEGLQIDADSVKVTVGGKEVTAGENTYTVTGGGEDGAAMSVTFAKSWILANPAASVTVTYDAALTAKAKVTKSGETIDYTNNSATITYTPDTNNKQTVTTDVEKVDVHTYGVEFEKKDPEKNALAGAVFTIYGSDGKAVQRDGKDYTCTSDSKGYVYFEGLAAGKYTIKETKVPAGYQKVGDFEVTLSDDTAKGDNPATKVTEANYDLLGEKVDPKQAVLPTTGDAGTFGITIAGVLLAAGGVMLVVGVRRRGQE